MRIRMTRSAICMVVILLTAVILAPPVSAYEISKTHGTLERHVGVGSWGFDTGWVGYDIGIGGYGKAVLKVGGDLLDVEENGQVKLETGESEIWFSGDLNGGILSQNWGVEVGAQVKIIVHGIGEWIWDLPYVGYTDLLLNGQTAFTPYKLNQTVVLQDYFPPQELVSVGFGVPWVLNGGASLQAELGDRYDLTGLKIETSEGDITSNGQRKDVTLNCSTPTLTVTGIRKHWNWNGTCTVSIFMVIEVTVLGTDYELPITIVDNLALPIDQWLTADFATTPSRSVEFPFECERLSLQGQGCGKVGVDGSDKSLPWSEWYPRDRYVRLDALPCHCWDFERWIGSINTVNDPIDVKMNNDKSATAIFHTTCGPPCQERHR